MKEPVAAFSKTAPVKSVINLGCSAMSLMTIRNSEETCSPKLSVTSITSKCSESNSWSIMFLATLMVATRIVPSAARSSKISSIDNLNIPASLPAIIAYVTLSP